MRSSSSRLQRQKETVHSFLVSCRTITYEVFRCRDHTGGISFTLKLKEVRVARSSMLAMVGAVKGKWAASVV